MRTERVDIKEEDLQERYRSLSTDELITIGFESELTTTARRVLGEGLSKRELTFEHIAHFHHSNAAIEAGRESANRHKFIVSWFFTLLGVVMWHF